MKITAEITKKDFSITELLNSEFVKIELNIDTHNKYMSNFKLEFDTKYERDTFLSKNKLI